MLNAVDFVLDGEGHAVGPGPVGGQRKGAWAIPQGVALRSIEQTALDL
jgi:hypothetical protein